MENINAIIFYNFLKCFYKSYSAYANVFSYKIWFLTLKILNLFGKLAFN